MAAEIERVLISERTMEALLARKEKGLRLRRLMSPNNRKLDKHRVKIDEFFANGSTQKFIAKKLRTTEANFHKWLKKNDVIPPQWSKPASSASSRL